MFTALACLGRRKVDQPTVWTFYAAHSCKVSGWFAYGDVRTKKVGWVWARTGVIDTPAVIIWIWPELVEIFFETTRAGAGYYLP